MNNLLILLSLSQIALVDREILVSKWICRAKIVIKLVDERPENRIYHINYGVLQGFPALRKAVTTHSKRYCIFSRVYNIANQLLTRHSPFAPLGLVNERRSFHHSQSKVVCRICFGLWLLKHWKTRVAFRQWRSSFSRRGRKPKYGKKYESYEFSGFSNGIYQGWERKSTTVYLKDFLCYFFFRRKPFVTTHLDYNINDEDFSLSYVHEVK